jgi:carbon-monoxide dehydrogenase medium subunit
VKPAAFAYAKARSLDDAIHLLGAHQGEAKLLAGGQSLIATLNMRLSSPSLLVDINGVAGLDGIHVKDGMVEIGALTRHVILERSSDIAKRAPLIALAMPHIAHPAIRNRGTIGGSLAYADPAAELPACLVARSISRDLAASAASRRAISSWACSRPRSVRTMCSARCGFRPPRPIPAWALPSWRGATATTRWSDWQPPRRRAARL